MPRAPATGAGACTQENAAGAAPLHADQRESPNVRVRRERTRPQPHGARPSSPARQSWPTLPARTWPRRERRQGVQGGAYESRVAFPPFAGKGVEPPLIESLHRCRAVICGDFFFSRSPLSRSPRLYGAGGQDSERRVLAVHLDNDINPVTPGLRRRTPSTGAKRRSSRRVVLVLDTPGGLAASMRRIVKRFLASKVPVIVYVAPPGSRADSAGVLIAMAADVAAMAPQTNIGSSTPISLGRRGHLEGSAPEDRQRRRGLRRRACRASTTATSWAAGRRSPRPRTTARARRRRSSLVDVIAPTLPALLKKIDGRKTVPKGFVLDTAGAQIENVEMSFWQRVRDTLIDPNLIALHALDRRARDRRRALEPGRRSSRAPSARSR